MSKIKSLADQLKQTLELQKASSSPPEPINALEKDNDPAFRDPIDVDFAKELFNAIKDFNTSGTQKIVVRLDQRTLTFLKQLKLTTNLDMTRVIVFSLHHFFQSHPWLNQYISQTLKNMTHELE